MKNIYFYNSYGKIKQAIKNLPDDSPALNEVSDAYGIVISDLDVSGDDYMVEEGELVELPAKPTNCDISYLVFDYQLRRWVDIRTEESQWELVRDQRNALLAQSDWTQLPDVPLATKEAWATYRQALRDITNQSDPFNIVWPTAPT